MELEKCHPVGESGRYATLLLKSHAIAIYTDYPLGYPIASWSPVSAGSFPSQKAGGLEEYVIIPLSEHGQKNWVEDQQETSHKHTLNSSS